MAFADPQSVTINAIPISLPRVSSGSNTGSFASADGLTSLRISHSYGNKRKRRVARLDQKKIAADPLLAGINVIAGMSCYLVIDVPDSGYTNAEAKLVIDGFLAALTASSGAKVTQLLGGEN